MPTLHSWQTSAHKTLGILIDRFATPARLAPQLNRGERTIREWRKDPSLISIEGFELIRALAEKMGLPVPSHVTAPKLYDDRLTFEENQTRDLGLWPELDASLVSLDVSFLGHRVRSPFGASASVVTANSALIDFLSHFGCAIITYKTTRSVATHAHDWPNIYRCAPGTMSLDPQSVDKPVIVGADVADFEFGQVNRFGMPSASPSVWQHDFKLAKARVGSDGLVILSVVGTTKDNTVDELVADFARVVSLGVEATADVIELNLSCPNCSGREGMVYHDLELSRRICIQAREAAGPNVKLLIKIGYMSLDRLTGLVNDTAPFVDGWTAINTAPVRAHKHGLDGYEPAFDSLERRAGLAGPPIFGMALETVRRLSDIRIRENLSNKVIVAVGGVNTPKDVITYLDSAADAVQAANVFFREPTFGMHVHRALVEHNKTDARLAKEHLDAGLRNWITAVDELDLRTDRELAIAAAVFREWKSMYERASAARKASAIAAVEYFRTTLRVRIPK